MGSTPAGTVQYMANDHPRSLHGEDLLGCAEVLCRALFRLRVRGAFVSIDLLDETAGFDANGLKLLVLDEADRILDLGFKATLTAILDALPRRHPRRHRCDRTRRHRREQGAKNRQPYPAPG